MPPSAVINTLIEARRSLAPSSGWTSIGAIALVLTLSSACGDSSQPAGADPVTGVDAGTQARNDVELGESKASERDGGTTPAGGVSDASGDVDAADRSIPSKSGAADDGSARGHSGGVPAEDPAHTSGGDVSQATPEELAEAMLVVPDELSVTSDESLAQSGDPEGYPLPALVGDVPVTIVRELHPASGILLRIYTVRADSVGEGAAPVLHGPEWSYFDTAALQSIQWWKENVAHGPAQHWRRVGTRKSEGRFHEGDRDGLRREYAKNGKMLSQGVYRRGAAIGLHEEWFPSGQKERSESFANGQLDGQRRVWDRDGLLVLDENYAEGVLHGRWSDFYPGDGDPREWGSYEAGQRVGIWQRGSKDGVILETTPYVSNQKHGLSRIWNAGGQLIEEVTYVEGARTGPRKTWYDDGTQQSQGSLEEGLREGSWTYWKADGSLNELWSGFYEGDQRKAPLGAGSSD